jgi:hypothetical protein
VSRRRLANLGGLLLTSPRYFFKNTPETRTQSVTSLSHYYDRQLNPKSDFTSATRDHARIDTQIDTLIRVVWQSGCTAELCEVLNYW